MGYPYLKNRTSQRVLLGHKLFADTDFLKELGKFVPPEVQVGQNWPLYGQRWPKIKTLLEPPNWVINDHRWPLTSDLLKSRSFVFINGRNWSYS